VLYVKKGSTIFMERAYGVPDVDRQLAIEKPIAQTVAPKVWQSADLLPNEIDRRR
jgi:hypothetical protein